MLRSLPSLAMLGGLGLAALSCGSDTPIPVQVTLRGPGVSSSPETVTIAEFFRGTGVIDPLATSVSLNFQDDGLFQFDDGCLMLQTARQGVRRRLPSIDIANSRSLFQAARPVEAGPLELVPLVSTEFSFPDGRSPLNVETLLGAASIPSFFNEASDSVFDIECSHSRIVGFGVELQVSGPGTVETLSGPRSLGRCTNADERGCRAVVSNDQVGVRVEPVDSSVAVEDISISCGDPLRPAGNLVEDLGDQFVYQLPAERCRIEIGQEATWTTTIDIRDDTAANGFELVFIDSQVLEAGPDDRQATLPAGIRSSRVELKKDGQPQAIAFVDGDCSLEDGPDGVFFLIRNDELRGRCFVAPEASLPSYTLQLGDSDVDLLIDPGPSGNPISCTVGQNPFCEEQLAGVLEYTEIFDVTVTATNLGASSVTFSGACAPPDTPVSSTFRVDGALTCTVQEVPPPDAVRLVLYMTPSFGTVEVQPGEPNAQTCSGLDNRWCELELVGPSKVRFSGVPGLTTFEPSLEPIPNLPAGANRPASRPVVRGCDDTAVFQTDPNDPTGRTFLVDPSAVAAGQGESRTQIECMPVFTCSSAASFDTATMSLISSSVAAEADFLADTDCAGGTTCSPKELAVPADMYELSVQVDSPAGARLLKTTGNVDERLALPPSALLNGAEQPYDASFALDPGAQVLVADILTCRGEGAPQRSRLQALVNVTE